MKLNLKRIGQPLRTLTYITVTLTMVGILTWLVLAVVPPEIITEKIWERLHQ